jgi:hypothetical protein
MTRDADDRTPLDEAIDEAARAMTRSRTPDLRSRVAERLDSRPGAVWWQPVMAAAVVLIGVLIWWPARDPLPVARHEEQATQKESAPAPTRSQRPRVARTIPGTAPPARLSARPAPPARFAVEPEAALPPLEVAPIAIDSIAIDTAVSIEEVEMSRLAVEPLDVEPLPRSNP